MKKIAAGFGLIFSGGLFYISAFMVGALNVNNTTSWQTSLGRFWGTIANYGLMLPLWFGIILILLGISFLLWGVFGNKNSSNK